MLTGLANVWTTIKKSLRKCQAICLALIWRPRQSVPVDQSKRNGQSTTANVLWSQIGPQTLSRREFLPNEMFWIIVCWPCTYPSRSANNRLTVVVQLVERRSFGAWNDWAVSFLVTGWPPLLDNLPDGEQPDTITGGKESVRVETDTLWESIQYATRTWRNPSFRVWAGFYSNVADLEDPPVGLLFVWQSSNCLDDGSALSLCTGAASSIGYRLYSTCVYSAPFGPSPPLYTKPVAFSPGSILSIDQLDPQPARVFATIPAACSFFSIWILTESKQKELPNF